MDAREAGWLRHVRKAIHDVVASDHETIQNLSDQYVEDLGGFVPVYVEDNELEFVPWASWEGYRGTSHEDGQLVVQRVARPRSPAGLEPWRYEIVLLAQSLEKATRDIKVALADFRHKPTWQPGDAERKLLDVVFVNVKTANDETLKALSRVDTKVKNDFDEVDISTLTGVPLHEMATVDGKSVMVSTTDFGFLHVLKAHQIMAAAYHNLAFYISTYEPGGTAERWSKADMAKQVALLKEITETEKLTPEEARKQAAAGAKESFVANAKILPRLRAPRIHLVSWPKGHPGRR